MSGRGSSRPALGWWLAALTCIWLAGTSPAVAQRTITPEPASKAPGASTYGESWAVVIGINDYQHPRVDKLRYAVNDARSVERALLTL
ncbi:MAG: hypothetical protein U1B78_01345, partial [Dehalococcoidia bacterium]|nr:hypothetical protein [Dehalococcoidia bacterium]